MIVITDGLETEKDKLKDLKISFDELCKEELTPILRDRLHEIIGQVRELITIIIKYAEVNKNYKLQCRKDLERMEKTLQSSSREFLFYKI